ncbi:putative anthocyanidin reductase [Durio zibethinus]|uniref:Anthocyanidin reductase n=1 Tax=Durio zibethinus TaxID=66656 RepID=A0A6P5XYS5_DURZI|nr:putative anthocyanidin reductase [Durio zibethinus]
MGKQAISKVCVTGGAGYLGSWLVKKLLEKGYTVHATLRNLEDKEKVGLLKSLPGADTKLVLFKADMYNPNEFKQAIQGCEFVFHVATPQQTGSDSTQSSQEIVEAAISAVRSIAEFCIQSQSVKRLIYTASVMASSPLTKDGFNIQSCVNESYWTPINVTLTHGLEFMRAYTISKTLAEKEALSYNDNPDGKLEVVTLPCGLVGGETLLSFVPLSVEVMFSQLIGKLPTFKGLELLEELLGSIPILHIEDVCDAHIFCMEKPSIRGRFICAAANPTIREIATYFRQNYPQFQITEEFMGEEKKGIACDSSKLVKMGFEYKHDMKKILDDSVICGRRLGAIFLN